MVVRMRKGMPPELPDSPLISKGLGTHAKETPPRYNCSIDAAAVPESLPTPWWQIQHEIRIHKIKHYALDRDRDVCSVMCWGKITC
jgi:hypothetical protein